MSELTNKDFDLDGFYSKIYKSYDLVNRIFTFGMDKKWRRFTVNECLKGTPKAILDLCCGTGDLTTELTKHAKQDCAISGYDLNNKMLDIARQKLKGTNTKLVQGNVASMPFESDSFDRISIGFGFRNLTYENSDSDKHIKEIQRILKPGGKLLILESSVPGNSIVRFFYNVYLHLFLIPLGGLMSGNYKAYKYLALSSSNYYSTSELKELLQQYKLSNFTTKKFFGGAASLSIVEKQVG